VPRPRSAERCGFTWLEWLDGITGATARICQRRIGHKPPEAHTHGKAKYRAPAPVTSSRKEK
jgi:hypothetical protein